MKERPILFSAPMVLALLAGTKTQTRRIAKFEQYEAGRTFNFGFSGLEAGFYHSDIEATGWVLRSRGAGGCWNDRTKPLHCPYGTAGDQLWVRETWAPCVAPIRSGHFQYAADGAVGNQWASSGGESGWSRSGHTVGITKGDLEGVWVGKPSKWRPSIHMPRKVSRIDLENLSVRVERVQSISEADAIAEGVIKRDSAHGGNWVDYTSEQYADGAYKGCVYNARDSYMTLWESINGAESWKANPWVWVVEFKRLP